MIRVKVPKGMGKVQCDAYLLVLGEDRIHVVPLLDPGPGTAITVPMKIRFLVSFSGDVKEVEGMGTEAAGGALRGYRAPFYDGQLIKVAVDVRPAGEPPRLSAVAGQDYFGRIQENVPFEFEVEIAAE